MKRLFDLGKFSWKFRSPINLNIYLFSKNCGNVTAPTRVKRKDAKRVD
jgi:hypothetical protein